MIKIIQFSFLIILIINFLSCSNKQNIQVNTQKEMPSWYTTPLKDTNKDLYGIGSGNSTDEAIKSALNNMISKLNISISSTFNSKTSTYKKYREYITQETEFSINTKVNDIYIGNYEVLKSKKYSYDTFLVLIKSNKQKFKSSLEKNINNEINNIIIKESNISNTNSLQRYSFYEKSISKLKEIFSSILVLNTLDESYDDSLYTSTFSKINKEFQKLKDTLTFSIHIKDLNSKIFVQEIKAGLNSSNKQVIKKEVHSKNHINIHLKSDVNYAKSNGFNIARISLTIEVLEEDKIIATNTINIISHSTQGDKIALNNSSKKLHKMIEKSNIYDILGININ